MAINKFKNILLNALVFILSFVLHKEKRVILVGAWMGKKFADNSRFLFQYLHENKEALHLKKVIWVTRSIQIKSELEKLGYDCVLIGTWDSFYWHCKAGVHILCNVISNSWNYDPDIDVSLSAGSKRVQLWHGNGVKCVPGGKRTSNKIKSFWRKITSQGCWYIDNYYLLCKSDLDFFFFQKKFCVSIDSCIDGSYPRVCPCVEYLDGEKKVIEDFKSYDKIILYLPTFRKNYDNYINPLSCHGVLPYIEEHGILWIEKPHTADANGATVSNMNNKHILTLNSNFDINVILPKIDLLVTDYSSVMLDALFYKKQIVYFAPDFDYFMNNDRGVIIDLDLISINPIIRSGNDILEGIKSALSKTEYGNRELSIRKMFWKYEDWDYQDIWKAIINKIYQ